MQRTGGDLLVWAFRKDAGQGLLKVQDGDQHAAVADAALTDLSIAAHFIISIFKAKLHYSTHVSRAYYRQSHSGSRTASGNGGAKSAVCVASRQRLKFATGPCRKAVN